MATNNLTTLLTGIADAIREKEGGGTTKINPQDFANRIRNLPSGNLVSEPISWNIADMDEYVFSSADTNGTYLLELRSYFDGTLRIVDGSKTLADWSLYFSQETYQLVIICDPSQNAVYFVLCGTVIAAKFAQAKIGTSTAISWLSDSSEDVTFNGIYIHP